MKATIFYGIFFIAVVLICVTAIKNYCKKLSSGCCGSGGSKRVRVNKVADRNPAHYPYTAVLTVDGMVCANCANTVANALNELGNVWATVDLSERKATVCMKTRLPSNTLRGAVSAAGPYTVLKISEASE